jgi:hypothetical protein
MVRLLVRLVLAVMAFVHAIDCMPFMMLARSRVMGRSHRDAVRIAPA